MVLYLTGLEGVRLVSPPLQGMRFLYLQLESGHAHDFVSPRGTVFVSPRGAVLSHKKKYGAKQVRYENGGRMNAKREEVEMRTMTKKEGRDFTS